MEKKLTRQTAKVRYVVEDEKKIYLGYEVASGKMGDHEIRVLDTGRHVVYDIGETRFLVSHQEIMTKILKQHDAING